MISNQFNQLLIVVDDQRFPLSTFQRVGRNAVFLHELVQNVPGNSSKLRTGDSKTLELSGIEAANDRLLADLANPGSLACGVDGLHVAHKNSLFFLTTPHGSRRADGHFEPDEWPLPWHDNRPRFRTQ